ncbi:hypothetical protein, partial [Klebsiella pneumoniae]|uniref:hypothetical protein n=1 Tax=Klebsiella pneumoniae TaxID=573 RepID=UPI002358B69B
YAASTSGNPSFSVLRQLQYLCELTQCELCQAYEKKGLCTQYLTNMVDFRTRKKDRNPRVAGIPRKRP